MKQMIFIAVILISSLFLTGCVDFLSAQMEASDNLDVDWNFCVVEDDDDNMIYCSSFELEQDSLAMVIEVTSSDVASLDGIVFELPDSGYYCTAEVNGNGYMWTDDDEIYYVEFTTSDSDIGDDCDFTDYADQDAQLAFALTLTDVDGNTVTINGDVTDTVE